MADLPFPEKIHTDSDKQVQFRTLIASFGDGYTQRAADGLNSKIDSFAIVWPGLNLADKDSVVAVLDSVGGWGVLTWKPPTESTTNKFTIDPEVGYSISYIGKRFHISTRLIQVFDL